MTFAALDVKWAYKDHLRKEVSRMLDKKDHEEIARLMRVIVESDITPALSLLIEGHKAIIDRLVPVSRVDGLEDEVKLLKIVVRQLSEDVQQLKKAQ